MTCLRPISTKARTPSYDSLEKRGSRMNITSTYTHLVLMDALVLLLYVYA